MAVQPPAQSCANCKFYLATDPPALPLILGKSGICRRFPPTIAHDVVIAVDWPPVAEDEWCGEWDN